VKKKERGRCKGSPEVVRSGGDKSGTSKPKKVGNARKEMIRPIQTEIPYKMGHNKAK